MLQSLGIDFLCRSIQKHDTKHVAIDTKANPLYVHSCDIEWQCLDVFESAAGLEELVVLTKLSARARKLGLEFVVMRADRIGDYVKERWPLLGPAIISCFKDVLSAVIDKPVREHIRRFGIDSFRSIAFSGTQSKLSIVAECTMIEWASITNCLEWVIGAIGYGTTGNEGLYLSVWSSEAVVDDERRKDAIVDVVKRTLRVPNREIDVTQDRTRHLNFDIYRPPDKQGNCWIHLFEAGFVATDKIQNALWTEKSGAGLRIPFDVLVSIAGIERGVERDGGLVLVGFSTALVPVKVVDPNSRSIQWHFIFHRDPGTRFRSIDEVEDFWSKIVPKNRLRETSIDKLNGVGYVGWHSEVNVSLGTQQIPVNPKCSGLPAITCTWKVNEKTKQITLGIGQYGSGSFSFSRTRQRVPLECRFRESSVFGLKLDRLFKTHVVIYDAERKIGWLCPTIHLIIYLVRSYISVHRYQPSNPNAIDFPERLLNADYSQIKTGLEKLHDVVIQQGLSRTYGELITDQINRYQDVFRSWPTGYRGLTADLIGFELVDILNAGEGHSILARRLPLNHEIRTWRDFVGNQHVVFVGNLEDPIKPMNVIRPCEVTPLYGHNVLVCPVYLLKDVLTTGGWELYEHGVLKRGDRACQWTFNGTPFSCSQGTSCEKHACWKYRLQQLQTKTYPRQLIELFQSRSPRISSQSLPYDDGGAVCFGVW